jgi:Golgi nucleoside diphosphatase
MLLEFAKEVVPPESHSTTPIYLMATAGMRLLPEEQQSDVLSATCEYVRKNTSFFFSDCNSHFKIIPGTLEGVYGWVAVNYLMGGFDTSIKSYIESESNQREQHHTFGFLDMGGASAQIAFEPEHHQKEEHMNDLTRIKLHTLDGHVVDYDVFVTTFLGYGSNEARRRYLEDRVRRLFEKANGKNILDQHHRLPMDDPCLPRNLNMTDTSSTSVALSLRGTGDFNQCVEYTSPLLNKDAECPTLPCLFNGVHTPHIDWSVNKFVGISEYWYSSHDILDLGGVYDFTEYEQKATSYCDADWSQLDIPESQISRYQMQCFKSAWIVNVLHEGIEIPRIVDPSGHQNITGDSDILEQSIESVESKNWNPPFQSIDTINDIQVSWTLGAMLLHVSSQIPVVDHNDGFQGHSTDDEGAHQIADGVEIPPTSIDSHKADGEATTSSTGLLDDIRNQSQSTTIAGVFILFVMGFLFWLLFKRIRKNSGFRRGVGSGETGANGGILGLEPSSTTYSLNPFTLLSSISQSISRSTVTLRHWASRLLRGRNHQYVAVNVPVDMDTFDESPTAEGGIDSTVINMNGPNDRILGPPTKSPSTVSKQYWNKKRYSGDSYNLSQMNGASVIEGSSVLPYRASSALGLANRNSSSSSLTARTGSSPNLNGLATPQGSTTIDRSPSPLASVTSEVTRSRSRVGFVIHEQSDEEDYAMSDGPGESVTWIQHSNSGSRRASPRHSPRGSLEERRKKRFETE